MLYRPSKPDGLILKVKKMKKKDTAFAGRRMLTGASTIFLRPPTGRYNHSNHLKDFSLNSQWRWF